MTSIQEISDHLAIIQIIQRYGKALDEKRFDLLRTVFTERAEFVYLIGKQLLEFPMDEAEKTFRSFLNKCYWTSHLISNPVIEFQNDRARASSHVTATHIQIREDGSRNTWIVSGAYEDELVRQAGGWRIQKRGANAPYEQGAFLAEAVREFQAPPFVQGAV